LTVLDGFDGNFMQKVLMSMVAENKASKALNGQCVQPEPPLYIDEE
jgi:hypothetical protein